MNQNGNRAPWPGWLAIAWEPKAYGALLYQFLGLPIGLVGFVWLSAGLGLSLGLIFVGIGILLGFGLLLSVRGIALAQARLAWGLTQVGSTEMPLVPQGTGFWNRYRATLVDPSTWLAQVYLLCRLPMGLLGFALPLAVLVISTALVGTAGLHWLGGQVGPDGVAHIQVLGPTFTFDPGDLEWSLLHLGPFGRVTTFCAGLLGLLGVLHLALGLTWLDAHLAKALLGRK